LPAAKADRIAEAAMKIANGELDAHFPVDVFQTGSGTSTNTNANEVIANFINRDQPDAVHPNDDVNLGQSSNDVIPTALHISVALAMREDLAPALGHLATLLEEKSEQWRSIVKIGRTHMMDAVPLSLGDEFSGYAAQIRAAAARANKSAEILGSLAIGGTAVGTGLNTSPEFGGLVAALISEKTGLAFREAKNHFEAQGGRDDCVEVAGQLQAICAALTKVANDIRLLGSGPRAGLGELILSAVQPGSSIMPGKVNPVMSEMLVQVCLYATGLCTSVVMAGRDGHLELNVTLPLMAHCLHESISCLERGARTFGDKCVAGIEPNEKRCRELVEQSLMLVTALTPTIGYDNASRVAKRALTESRTLREIVLEEKLLDAETLDRALNPAGMIRADAENR
jgi:fumarate hydratase class II